MSNSMPWLAAILVGVTLGPIDAGAQDIMPGMPIVPRRSRIAWLDLGKVPSGWGLIRSSTDTLPVRWEQHLGFEGILPGENSPDPSLYLAVAPGFLWRTTGTFFLAIEYWDRETGAFEVQYMRDVGPATPTSSDVQTKRFYTGGTRLWQRENLALRNARMRHDLPHGADLRLIPPGTPVRRVFLSRLPLGEVDRIQPWGARRKVVEPPEALSVFIRPSHQDQLLREGPDPRREQWLKLYASWGAEAVLIAIERGQLITSNRPRESTIGAWPTMFRDQPVNVVLDICTGKPDEVVFSIWDPGEIERWEQAARTVSRVGSRGWLAGVVVDLRDVVGIKASPALQATWQTPAVLQDFRRAVRKELGTLPKINRAWGTQYRRQEDIAPFLRDQAPSLEAARFVNRWLRQQQAYLLDRVLHTWRSFLPRHPIFVRIPCQIGWGKLDPRDVSEIAARYDASLLTSSEGLNPAIDPDWLLLARAARRAGVRIGLDVTNEEDGPLSAALFALATEGGTVLVFSEEHLANRERLDRFKSGVELISGARRSRSAAVIYPWTTIESVGCEAFDGLFGQLRDAVSVDLLDERDLIDPSRLTGYSVLVHLAGDTWSEASLAGLEQWVRLGRLFLCAGDQRIADEHGRLEVMTRLFPFELRRHRRSLTLSPISDRLRTISILSPFEDLRAGWLKEVGRGYTLYVPRADQNPEAYIGLIAMVTQDPSLISPRLKGGVSGDGSIDNLFSAGIGSDDVFLNLTPHPRAPDVPPKGAGKRRSPNVPAWGLARFGR